MIPNFTHSSELPPNWTHLKFLMLQSNCMNKSKWYRAQPTPNQTVTTFDTQAQNWQKLNMFGILISCWTEHCMPSHTRWQRLCRPLTNHWMSWKTAEHLIKGEGPEETLFFVLQIYDFFIFPLYHNYYWHTYSGHDSCTRDNIFLNVKPSDQQYIMQCIMALCDFNDNISNYICILRLSS